MVLTFVSFISYEILCIYFFVCVKGKLIRYRYFFDTHVIDCFLRKMNLLLFNFITIDFQELLYDLLYHTQEKNVFYRERERERERERAQIFFFLNIFVYVSMIWDQQISFAMSKPSQLFSTSKSSLICSISFFVAVILFFSRQF